MSDWKDNVDWDFVAVLAYQAVVVVAFFVFAAVAYIFGGG